MTCAGISPADEGNDKNIIAVRISKLIAHCNQLQNLIYWLAFPADKRIDDLEPHPQDGLSEQIRSLVNEVEDLCAQVSASPMDLPGRSRQAYQWLKFLSDPAHLQMHVAALQTTHAACSRLSCRRKGPPGSKSQPVRIQFYLFNALYRVSFRRDVTLIQANEGFITAPPPVIEALIEAAICQQGQHALGLVRQYADSAEYSRSLEMLVNGRLQQHDEIRGKVHDLEASFTRVNLEYFNGRMERPRLSWNRTLTYRKLGHYQPNIDTVQISITLDQTDVPEFILDYVMYHELLHNLLGIHYKNGRRSAHTSRFRAEERKFQHYAEALEFINQIGLHLPAGNKSMRKVTVNRIARK
jgi:hypothetical protein